MRICATRGPLCRGVEGAPSWTLSSEAARPVTFIHISLCGFFRHREPTNQFLSSVLFKRTSTSLWDKLEMAGKINYIWQKDRTLWGTVNVRGVKTRTVREERFQASGPSVRFCFFINVH